jgi:hypothetical protein
MTPTTSANTYKSPSQEDTYNCQTIINITITTKPSLPKAPTEMCNQAIHDIVITISSNQEDTLP